MRVSIVLGVVALSCACNSSKKPSATVETGAPGAATSASASPSASAAIVTPGAPRCTVGEPKTIAKSVRSDAGLTLAYVFTQWVVGYATGDDGTPRAAVLDVDGTATFPAVDDQLRNGEALAPGAKRKLLRVTPLGWDATTMEMLTHPGLAPADDAAPPEQTMRVAVDFVDRVGDTTTYLRCGPADTSPFFSEGGAHAKPSDKKVLDCRTFSSGRKEWSLASVATPTSVQWTVNYATGRNPVQNVILDDKTYDATKLAKPELYTYQVPVGGGFTHEGFVFTARQEGALVVVLRDEHLQKVGDASRFSLAGTPTMTALAIGEPKSALFTTLAGQTDVYGATFRLTEKPSKPEKLTIDDPKPPASGDRNSLAASISNDRIFLAFADGPAANKRARMTVLGADLKSRVPVFDVGGDENTGEVRVAALNAREALVVYLAANTIKSVIVTCADAAQ